MPSHLSLICFGQRGRGNSLGIRVSSRTRLIIACAGGLGPGLRVPRLRHPIPWAPTRGDLLLLPPVGHVLVLSKANSDAKEYVGIGYSDQDGKAALTRRGWGGGGEKSLRRADPRVSGARGVKRVLGQSWALTVDFSVYGKAETLGANNTDVKRQHNQGESVKGGGEGEVKGRGTLGDLPPVRGFLHLPRWGRW